jgi:exportin-5
MEALHSLYGRTHLNEAEFSTLVSPMYLSGNVSLLRNLYAWSMVDCHDIEPTKYSFSKKFSEVSSVSRRPY